MFEDMFMMPPSNLGDEVELMPLFSIGDDGSEKGIAWLYIIFFKYSSCHGSGKF